jgi:predicted nucleotidyltransferase
LSVTTTNDAALVERLAETLGRHPAVHSVALTGSRARGEAQPVSDWDFELKTNDFQSVADALHELMAPLEPLAQQWDRLSRHACYMLMLRGIGKVDLIFEEPWETSPPWDVSAETLRGIDDHFWDWTIWLAAKDQAGNQELVASELSKMHEHLLGPLGVTSLPLSIADAVRSYTAARGDAEKRLAVVVPRAVEDEVRGLLAAGGYAI